MSNHDSKIEHTSDSAPSPKKRRAGPHVRLSLNVNPAVADVLKDYADREGVSITEAVRRAVTVFDIVDSALERDASLAVTEKDNSVREVEFVF